MRHSNSVSKLHLSPMIISLLCIEEQCGSVRCPPGYYSPVHVTNVPWTFTGEYGVPLGQNSPVNKVPPLCEYCPPPRTLFTGE